jgi:hypothetical protein
VDEDELIAALQAYFAEVLQSKKNIIHYVVGEFNRLYKAKSDNVEYEKELRQKLSKLNKTRQKYMDMYADDLITRQELNDRIGGMKEEIARIENDLKLVSFNIDKGEQLEGIIKKTFDTIESITDVRQLTNAQLKQVIQKIEVDQEGNVDIYLRLLGDLGLDETVLISDNRTDSHLPPVPSAPRRALSCAVLRFFHQDRLAAQFYHIAPDMQHLLSDHCKLHASLRRMLVARLILK